MKILAKKLNQLNASELEQLEALIYRYYNSASPKFIADRLKKDYGYDIVMLKKGDIIQGVNFYHLTKYKAKPHSRTQYILHFGQAMKRSGYKGNIIWRLGIWYSQRNIGWAYLLKDVTGIASFISPKAFEHYTRLFPRHHYKLLNEENHQVLDFIGGYFNHFRGLAVNYGPGFCFDSSDLKKEDITDDWERVYRAKSESINHLFTKSGIIEKKNGRIYKLPRHITVVGIRRPIPFDKKLKLPSSEDLKGQSARKSGTENLAMPSLEMMPGLKWNSEYL